MKKLSLIAAAIALASSSAFAATTTDSFDVSVNFTGACGVKTAASDMSFTYTSFGAAQSASTSTVFECSRGLTPTFQFNDNGGTQTGSAAAALGTAITGEGVISGIRYTLSGTTAKTQTGSAASAGTGGTGGSNGTADEYTVSITAAVPANQAGSGTGASGTHTRVLTISY
jgi:hypothetical protein